MNAKDFEHTIKGNITLYKAIERRSRRQKSFLNRNLVQALQAHQLDLEMALRASRRDGDGGDAQTSMTTAPKPQENQRPEWDFNLPDHAFNELAKSERPMLQIRGFQIRRQGTQRREADHDADGMDWLPGPGVRVRQSCTVTLKVLWSHREILVVPQTAMLEGHGSGNDLFFDIQLSKPFVIELDRLRTERNGFDREGLWHSPVGDTYMLETTLQCNDLENAQSFIGLVDPIVTSDVLPSLSPSETRLRSRCSISPRLPEDGLLALMRKSLAGPERLLEFGLAIDMNWSRPNSDSILARHNARQRREVRVSQPAQLPTPELSVSELPEDRQRSVRIKWIFKRNLNAFVHHTSGWRCAICQAPTNPPHSSLAYLRLHLTLHHDYLHFTPESDPSEPERILIYITETEKTYASMTGPPEQGAEEYYIRPQRPFDQSRYLENKDKWTGHQVHRGHAVKSGNRRGRKPREPREFVGRPAPVPAPKRPASPSQVQDLPERPRKRHVVPSVPNVMFFRKSSTRVARGGESLSDSDDDIDSTWVSQYRRRDMKQLGLPQSEIELVELLNCHLEKENANGDAFLMQALVRFTRRHRSRLRKNDTQREFKKRLEFFSKYQLIDSKAVQRCMELIDRVETQLPSTPTKSGKVSEPQSAARDRSSWVPGAGFTGFANDTDEEMYSAPETAAEWHPMQIRREISIVRPGKTASELEPWVEIDQRRRHKDCGKWTLELDSFWETRLNLIAAEFDQLSWKNPSTGAQLSVSLQRHGSTQSNRQILYDVLRSADRALPSSEDDIILVPTSKHGEHSSHHGPLEEIDCNLDTSNTALQSNSSHDLLDKRNFLPSSAFIGLNSHAQRESGKYASGHITTPRMIMDVCSTCRRSVVTARGAIACENPSCTNGSFFHLACVKLDRRPRGPWFCESCSTATGTR